MTRLAQVGVCLALVALSAADGLAGHFWCSLTFGATAAGCAVCFAFGGET